MDEEIWKDIKGYDGKYQVSNLGRVRSFKYNKERILQLHEGRHYYDVGLWKNGKRKIMLVHRLVGEYFVEGRSWLCNEINHRDENPHNNRWDNLEWCTRTYNIRYGTRSMRQAMTISKRVYQYTVSGSFVAEYGSLKEASFITDVDASGISLCCHGRYSQAGGYVWSLTPPTNTRKATLF